MSEPSETSSVISDIDDIDNIEDDDEEDIEDDTQLFSNDDSISNKHKNTLNLDTKIVSYNDTYSNYYNQNKITKPFLTKYEKAKILGVRSQMLSNGSIPMIIVDKNITDTLDIARLELEQKKIPLLIRRYLPNKEFEDWILEELIIS